MPNKIPQTRVLRPVLAPALMPAADSGEMRIGGPVKYPLRMVVRPHTMSKKLPLGMAPLFLVSPARSERDRARPFNVRKYKNSKLKTSRTIFSSWEPIVFSVSGCAAMPLGHSAEKIHHMKVPNIRPTQNAPLMW